MPRPVRIRASYAADAGFLTRLMEAVEKDERQDPAWRKEVTEKLRDLVSVLLDARTEEGKQRKKSARAA